jgi:KaiC/GvpD/RAD55 family RecA-like ATPase
MSLLQKPISIDYEHDCRFVNPASTNARGRFLPVLSERGIFYPLTPKMNDYTLGIKELDEAIGDIKKGSNIMLIGPPMSGKEVILRQIMYHAAVNEEALIIVTTQESGAHILEWFHENKLTLPLLGIGIVDCVTKNRSSENESIKMINGPADLTGIGVRISQFIREFYREKKMLKIQLHIDSISTLLMYTNIEMVFRFLHVLTARIKANGGLGIYTLDSQMHDKRDISILKHLFDYMIEIKSENDKKFLRMVGLSSKPTQYFEYETEGTKVKIVGRK